MKGEANRSFLLELGTACPMEHPQQGGGVPRITQEMFHNPIPLSLSFFLSCSG